MILVLQVAWLLFIKDYVGFLLLVLILVFIALIFFVFYKRFLYLYFLLVILVYLLHPSCRLALHARERFYLGARTLSLD